MQTVMLDGLRSLDMPEMLGGIAPAFRGADMPGFLRSAELPELCNVVMFHRRDTAAFRTAFLPDARLRSYAPGGVTPFADLVRHEQLATIPDTMRGMYGSTTHMMTNHLVMVDGDAGSGQVLCTARHLVDDGDASVSLNVIIRYFGQYVRAARGASPTGRSGSCGVRSTTSPMA